jgi:protocatechuate 3,4-dioxygenase beta subunit
MTARRALLAALLSLPLAALAQAPCGAPTPGDMEGPPYMGRPRHIHVKLQRPGGKLLTTQLYFPGESRGADKALVVRLERRDGVQSASFDFVLF